ncbi:MAG: Wzz/FepE/Etk N-terminal domain-containing protein, partial [Lachnospiraceae bacterium]|nr:Wzz/FepE/Etk N-terminal domain-containing protein [Lachnospiraceae bacterium]
MHSQERIIDLIALIRSLLKKWRGMLICAIVFALLFGAYAYMTRKQYTAGTAGSAEEEESDADAYAKELKIINDSLENKNRYILNSKLLQLDPNAVSRAFV